MSDLFGIGGVAQAAGSVAGAAIQAAAISDAASKAQQSANKAQDLLQGRYDTTRGDLLPYNQSGTNASQILSGGLAGGIYGNPIYGDRNAAYIDEGNNSLAHSAVLSDLALAQSDAAQRLGQGPAGQAQLAALPGYQFALAQGLQANQNAMAAKGLGVSGAAMKGAATFATGLADQTYGQQFNRLMQGAAFTAGTAGDYRNLAQGSLSENAAYQGNLTASYNRLLGVAGLGENAGAQTGNSGATLGNAQAGAITAGGAAGAAGSIAGGNALAGGINGVTNAFTQNQALQAFQQQQSGGINGAAGVNGLTQTDSSGNTSFF